MAQGVGDVAHAVAGRAVAATPGGGGGALGGPDAVTARDGTAAATFDRHAYVAEVCRYFVSLCVGGGHTQARCVHVGCLAAHSEGDPRKRAYALGMIKAGTTLNPKPQTLNPKPCKGSLDPQHGKGSLDTQPLASNRPVPQQSTT